MNLASQFLLQDFRQIFRDRTLILFFIFPFIQFFLLKFGVPPLVTAFPVIGEYLPHVNMFGGLQVAIMFGIISMFILMDEKDEQLIPVLKILPITGGQFLIYRLTIITIITAVGSFLMMYFSGLVSVSSLATVLIAIQFGAWVPIIFLSMGYMADNKVQALAYFKGINILMIAPIIVFLFPNVWKYIASFLPLFWPFDAYITFAQTANGWFNLGVGLLFHILLIFILGKLFIKKNWR